ncbi:MAG: hypothetical protein JRF33_21785 [Deltaproteobacteria bacterium]|nr:hypothetical protein [Deltaproteobacteria bacterium]
MKTFFAVSFVFLFCSLTTQAQAVEKVYKHDQFPENLPQAAVEISGIALATQPGFALGEAIGQLYRPDPEDYPVNILGLEFVFAAPPNMADGEANAIIEIWAHSGDTATPTGAEPIFSITTADLYNPATGGTGMPLVGSTGFVITFDQDDPANHPPAITDGNFMVMVRFTDESQSLATEWGTYQCTAMPSVGACGCQEVGTIHDQATTDGANIFHIIGTAGTCVGDASNWTFIEDLGVSGDIIMRVRADVAGVCEANCEGLACGDDGCGGSCGDCQTGYSCQEGICIEDSCTPDCDGKDCGDDGCGGSCGDCQTGFSCQNGVCIDDSCTPDCDGKECGDDGCGGSCGDCQTGYSCQDGACIDDSCTPDCDGKECGDDGCGGSCGDCATGRSCENNICVDACTPDCDGKECGDDGCGGLCGQCADGRSCEAGVCRDLGDTDEDGGCACASAGAPSMSLLLLVGLFLAFRRRRSR